MLRQFISKLIREALDALARDGQIAPIEGAEIEVSDPKSPDHGDYASNVAMVLAKRLGLNPRDLATRLVERLEQTEAFDSIEIAGPGFINFRLGSQAFAEQLARPFPQPESRGKINVEFVSVNPNGPITIGSGRGAAYGSCLCRVLAAAGYHVHREYYINDGVNSEQMRLFAESVRSYLEGLPFPEKGYKGDYVQAVAERLRQDGTRPSDIDAYQTVSQDLMLERQRADLAAFGVEFDTWFSEQSLHDSGAVAAELQLLMDHRVADDEPVRVKLKLAKGGKIDEVEREVQTAQQGGDDDESAGEGELPTVWLRSTKFGDDMDRVLRRRDGRLTYIASDVAYHKDKLGDGSGVRGSGPVDKMITVLGPDHHGYIHRLQAVVAADLMPTIDAGASPEGLDEHEQRIYRSAAERDAAQRALAEAKSKLEVLIFQLVRFVKDGQPAPMRKRDGNIYALIDLIREIGIAAAPDAGESEQLRIGRDVARFFYLMRSHDTTMDFDLDLAARMSDDNPVFYVQYAHARICSILEKAGGEPSQADFTLLTDPRERALIKKTADLTYEIDRCAADYGVHRLATYAQELARSFHHFYDGCRVILADQPELTAARLGLCVATRDTLRRTFELLGISAPNAM